MYDLIVVGGGVSGFTAALYAARRGVSVLVVGKDVGGQANLTDLIENYPGIEAVGGLELVSKIRKQAEAVGSKWLAGIVEKIKPAGEDFVLTISGMQYKTKAVILAFGKIPRDLNVKGEKQFVGKGVSYCASCDLPLFKKKTVAVVGSGDLALDAALSGCRYASKIYLISNTKPSGHPALLAALGKKKKVEIMSSVEVTEVFGRNRLQGLVLNKLPGREKLKIYADGLFVERGYEVGSDFLVGLLDLDDKGQIVVGSDQSTSLPGVFAAGDATNRAYKQAVISAGDAALAALSAYDWLMRRRGMSGLTSDWTQVKRVK